MQPLIRMFTKGLNYLGQFLCCAIKRKREKEQNMKWYIHSSLSTMLNI